VTATAISRARTAFKDDVPEGGVGAGYIDVLGAGPAPTGIAQRLMLSRAVPEVYERWWRPAFGRVVSGLFGGGMAGELRTAHELLRLDSADFVVDLACGPGNFSRPFAATVGPEGLVVGVDASPTMLARAAADIEASGVQNLALVRADATALPFDDASFDAASCFAALHLFAEPLAAIAEMRRVLRPGGRIALMTSVRRGVFPDLLVPAAERVSGMRLFGRNEITAALADQGFGEIAQRVAGVVQWAGGRLPG
jgi:ubiquinone/menaquinone biosynthesis C-methylase UbiE